VATPDAVIFDLDGVLLDSEQRWNEAKQQLVRTAGGRWPEDAPTAMMGMSSPEWSAYMRDELGVPRDAAAINSEVVGLMEQGYARELPLLPGAVEAVRRIAAAFPLALASSSNRAIFEEALRLAGIAGLFRATVSSEEVARGKPAPDVYLEAAKRLGVAPERCAAVEDSHSGIASAKAAGMRVIAIPNASYPPGDEALALADVTLASLEELTPTCVEGA
jgi:HAD superfamily hydrolase (TIGR01509 family)